MKLCTESAQFDWRKASVMFIFAHAAAHDAAHCAHHAHRSHRIAVNTCHSRALLFNI
jgi:hypothetical protein